MEAPKAINRPSLLFGFHWLAVLLGFGIFVFGALVGFLVSAFNQLAGVFVGGVGISGGFAVAVYVNSKILKYGSIYGKVLLFRFGLLKKKYGTVEGIGL